MTYDPGPDLQKLQDVFAGKDEMDSSKLADVICHRTNIQLKTLQETFSKNHQDQLLINDLKKKINKASLVSDRDIIIDFITRVLADSYRAGRDSAIDTDTVKAKEDADKLHEEFDSGSGSESDMFMEVFVNEAGSMTFAQVKATRAAFGDEDALEEDIDDTFDGAVKVLFKSYIEYAAK